MVNIKGFGVTNQITEMNKIIIPGTYYNPKLPDHLLSPQHWAQTSSNPAGTTSLTTHNAMTLSSKSLWFRSTVHLDHNTNCCFVCSTTGFKNHQVFMTMFPLKEEPTCFMEHFRILVEQDEIKTDDNPPISTRFEQVLEHIKELKVTKDKKRRHEDKLLRVQNKFRHMSFTKIRFMAALGWIEPKLAKCGCLYGKATCKPWWTKRTPNNILRSSKSRDVVLPFCGSNILAPDIKH